MGSLGEWTSGQERRQTRDVSSGHGLRRPDLGPGLVGRLREAPSEPVSSESGEGEGRNRGRVPGILKALCLINPGETHTRSPPFFSQLPNRDLLREPQFMGS